MLSWIIRNLLSLDWTTFSTYSTIIRHHLYQRSHSNAFKAIFNPANHCHFPELTMNAIEVHLKAFLKSMAVCCSVIYNLNLATIPYISLIYYILKRKSMTMPYPISFSPFQISFPLWHPNMRIRNYETWEETFCID